MIRKPFVALALAALVGVALAAAPAACVVSGKTCTVEETKKCDDDLNVCIAKPPCDNPADPGYQSCLDACKKALDCLKPGDVAIFATPPAFRWVHFTYAIQKNLNVFMEKPVTVDGPTSKRLRRSEDRLMAKKKDKKKDKKSKKKSKKK